MNRIVLALFAGAGAALAIGVLAYSQTEIPHAVLLMAPFGATTVLVFGIPDSPLAQTKNVIFGHLITAFIGIFFSQLIGVSPFTLAMASGLAVSAMLLTKTTHPPAGANPILIMLSGQSWGFLLTPVLIGAVVIVVLGKCMQRLQRRLA
ncbi:HPP family protein [Paraglaciecola sp.]|uniref:HPP family protein n=1 Tax=Paraglaciecola sp. TaxID=1920173 RepID=UPI0030F45795